MPEVQERFVLAQQQLASASSQPTLAFLGNRQVFPFKDIATKLVGFSCLVNIAVFAANTGVGYP